MKPIPENNFRHLSPQEMQLLQTLLQPSFPGRNEIAQQVKHAQARSTEDQDNYGSIYLKTSFPKKAQVKERVPVEGHIQDSDGVPVEVLLHVVDGYINELEIVKADGSPILQAIKPEGLKVKER